jgi:hypothetical protein
MGWGKLGPQPGGPVSSRFFGEVVGRLSLLKPNDVRDLRNGKVLERLSDNTVVVTLGPGDGTLLEVIGQD